MPNKSRNASLKLVSELAGVSATTVSRVLNNSPIPTEETRRRVMEVVEKVGYRPDPLFREGFRRLRRGQHGQPIQTHAIGYLIHERIATGAAQHDGFYSHAMASIFAAAKRHRYFLILEMYDYSQPRLPEVVSEGKVDGLVAEVMLPDELVQQIVRRVPVVFVDYLCGESTCDVVLRDDRRAIEEMLDYLWGLGHRNIALFTDASHRYANEITHQGFWQYYQQRGTPMVHPHLCQRRQIDPTSHVQVMDEFVREVLQAEPRPTAMLASSMVYAWPIYQRLQAAGIHVPQEMSVASLEDYPTVDPANVALITSYLKPLRDMGDTAAELLVQRIRFPKRGLQRVLIAGRLLDRGSCARVPGNLAAAQPR